MKAVFFPEGNRKPSLVDIDANSRDVLQGLIGGYLERLNVQPPNPEDATAHGYCNDEHRFKGCLPNPQATAFFHGLGQYLDDYITGNIVILGDDPGDPSREGDVPEWVVARALRA
jgi:hypothetical protein